MIKLSAGAIRTGYTGLPATNCITPQMMMPQPPIVIGAQSCRPTYPVGTCPRRYAPCAPAVPGAPVGPFVVPTTDGQLLPGMAGLGQQPVPREPTTSERPLGPAAPAAAPTPPPSGPTGVETIDTFLATPLGKAATVGAIAAGVAKTFPNQIVVPVIAGAILSVFTGLVPEPKLGV